MESQKHYNIGKMFAKSIDVEVHCKGELYYACVTWGENYYETDPYKNMDYALSEAKGYLEGLAIKLDGELNDLDRQLLSESLTD